MAIATTGDFRLLVSSGEVSPESLFAQWEEIVKRNSRANGSNSYNAYFILLKTYAQLITNYTITKLSLWKLALVIDYEEILEVRARGYKINLDSATAYSDSLSAALRKVENLITRANMKRKEIESMQKGEGGQQTSFEEILANLCASLGFEVKDDLTLARYNEYKKIIKLKAQRHGRNK